MDPWRDRLTRPAVRLMRLVLEWIGRHELKVMIALLLLVGSVWVFIELADQVMDGETPPFDVRAIRAMRRADDLAQPIGPRWLAEAARDITALGGFAFLTLLTAAIAGFLWLRGMHSGMWLLIAATLGGVVVNVLLKGAFGRPRPQLVPHLVQTFSSSFPSGHAMLSATVFLTIGALLSRFVREFVLKAYFLVVAVLLTLLVGLSRIYLGVHYPTDVLSGWSAGMAWAIICWLVARIMQRRHIVESDLLAPEGASREGTSDELPPP